MRFLFERLLGIFRMQSELAPVVSNVVGGIEAYLASSKISVQYPPPNGDAGMWYYEVTATGGGVAEYEVTVKELGKREKASYRYSTFTPDQVWDVIRQHIASRPMPKPKGKSRKAKQPSIGNIEATYRVTLPGVDKQGRPRLCEVMMMNAPLCLGHEGPERPSPSGAYKKTWEEKIIHDPRPCHAQVCRVVDGRRGAKMVGVPTEGFGLADAMHAATVADERLDWR